MGNFSAVPEFRVSHFLGLEEESAKRGRGRELRLGYVVSAPLPVPGARSHRNPQQASQQGGSVHASRHSEESTKPTRGPSLL